jgi:anti-anti-sigma regulatory factor
MSAGHRSPKPLPNSCASRPQRLNLQHIPAKKRIQNSLAPNVPLYKVGMLRISVTEVQETIVLDLEGRLAGPWISELERCWRDQQARSAGRAILVRLRAVTFIDDAGKELLKRMFEQNSRLEGAGCLVRAILAEITGQQPHRNRSEPVSGSKT